MNHETLEKLILEHIMICQHELQPKFKEGRVRYKYIKGTVFKKIETKR